MSKMRVDTTPKTHWAVLRGPQGILYIPLADLTYSLPSNEEDFISKYDDLPWDNRREFKSYYNGTIETVEIVVGYGARLVYDGYIDATDWEVYSSLEEHQDCVEQMLSEEGTVLLLPYSVGLGRSL